jgi:hypothetical protein
MSTGKRKITFYASPKVAEWYDSLPAGNSTPVINELLEASIEGRKPNDLAMRVAKLEEAVALLEAK